ncbi:DNA polymerase III subunit delta [Balneolaceae bacterium ANBcel3]|nr:DNA polymerase III subunit delta [Balneolaceae bacterium ANBcel3]
MSSKISELEHFYLLKEEILKKELKPVYAFFGSEEFFIDRLQEALISRIPEEIRDFNMDVLYGLDISVEKLVGICRSYPMMSEYRFVIVRDFMKMFGKEKASQDTSEEEEGTSGEETSKGSVEDLITYLDKPTPSTILFLTNEKRPPLNTKLGGMFRKRKDRCTHAFEPVGEHLLQAWITEWAEKEYGLQLEDQAAQLLGYHVGNHLQQLTVEIDKLANYTKKDSTVSVDHVRKLVGLSREYTMFEFSDALLEKDKEKTLFIADKMLSNADSPAGEVIKMIGFLYSMFGKIWHIQRLSRKGMNPQQIRNALGIKSTFYYNKMARAGHTYPLAVCPWIFEVLLDADKAIKGFSKESPEAILLMTIKKMTE